MKRFFKIILIVFLSLTFMVSFFAIGTIAQGFFGGNSKTVNNSDNNHIDENKLPKEEVKGEEVTAIEDEAQEAIEEAIRNKEPNNINEENPLANGGKKVFLTFDDGPTKITTEILEILKENQVNASFFVIGKLLIKNTDIALKAYEEGNMILPHTYTHDYSIYSTLETFYEDFYAIEKLYEEVMGFKAPPILRFPGGSSNHSSFDYGGREFMPLLTEDIKKKGYYYIDWNVNSGDTGIDFNDGEKMLENIKKASEGKDFIVILFHDTEKNKEMVSILPQVIEYYRDNGYTFRTFRDITEEELDKMIELKLSNKPIVR
ncbi:polysaccharide deacetylase family protein [Alkaliphilus pronyensis]|nr:polysaccharide deacetylase family protein [Alkaliphilus pronyensis]